MSSSKRQGPPKHQNKYAWKPNAGCKINESELGGKLRPFASISGVCPRCKEQIDWKRRYGKYKPILEPAKCQKCGKRSVRQAYHNICSACSKDHGICAKCCCRTDDIVGRDVSEVESERKALEEAIKKNARERDRRTLLRAMDKKSPRTSPAVPKIGDRSREGDLFPAKTLDEYAANAGLCDNDKHDEDDTDEEREEEDSDEEDLVEEDKRLFMRYVTTDECSSLPPWEKTEAKRASPIKQERGGDESSSPIGWLELQQFTSAGIGARPLEGTLRCRIRCIFLMEGESRNLLYGDSLHRSRLDFLS